MKHTQHIISYSCFERNWRSIWFMKSLRRLAYAVKLNWSLNSEERNTTDDFPHQLARPSFETTLEAGGKEWMKFIHKKKKQIHMWIKIHWYSQSLNFIRGIKSPEIKLLTFSVCERKTKQGWWTVCDEICKEPVRLPKNLINDCTIHLLYGSQ